MFVKHPRGGCFVCENEFIKMDIDVDFENLTAKAEVILGVEHQGPPTFAHGGIIATLLDEVMSMSVGNHFPALLAKIKIEYKKPVPLFKKIEVLGKVIKIDGRKIFTEGEIKFEGITLTKSTGLYIKPKFIENRSLIIKN